MIPAPNVAGIPNRRMKFAGDVGLVVAATDAEHTAAPADVS
jgi:hypothetical protein